MFGEAASIAAVSMAAFVVFILAARTLRRVRGSQDTGRPPPPSFDLVQLRAMLANQEITVEEVERLKNIVSKPAAPGPLRSLKRKPGFDVIFKDPN